MAKREAEDEVDSEMRKRSPIENTFTLTRQSRWTELVLAATGEINSRDSPLLRLPAELRIQIYGYVLGYKHIYPDYPHAFRGYLSHRLICDCDGARDDEHHSRNYACFSASLHLGLLSTCRRIYSEAFPILWSTNIFCFEDSLIMSSTLPSLAPRQASLIKNLRLDINIFVESDDWESDLRSSNLTSLQGLRNLQLFSHTYEAPRRSTRKLRYRPLEPVDTVWKLSYGEASPAVISTRCGRVYPSDDPVKLLWSFETEERIKRLQSILADGEYPGGRA